MSDWWDKVRSGYLTEGFGLRFSEPVCRALHRLARSEESENNLDALEKLLRGLADGIPSGAKRVRAAIPLYKLVVGPFRLTLSIRDDTVCVERLTRLTE